MSVSTTILADQPTDREYFIGKGDTLSAYVEGKLMAEHKFTEAVVINRVIIFESHDFLDVKHGYGGLFCEKEKE